MPTTITAQVPLLGGVYDIQIDGTTIQSLTKSESETTVCAGPGLFDIQVNGYGGRACKILTAEKKDALAWITRLFREVGVGWWIPTLVTGPFEVLQAAFKFCAEVMEEDADTASSIPGFHLEGPFISPVEGPRGAHVLADIQAPDFEKFQRLQEAAGGRIMYVTVAPEVDGCIDFIKKTVDSGVVISLGHTGMDRDAFNAAINAGATMSTHLGNGAHDMIQRHNNYIWYQLASRKTYASFITDGQHLPPECLYSMIHAKGLDKSIITSDTVMLGGMPAGDYDLKDRVLEKLPNGRINVKGSPNLSGSSSNLLECMEVLIRDTNLTQAKAWEFATINPAKMLGLEDRLGMQAGKEATLTLYNYNEDGPSIEILETWVAGKKVFDSKTTERAVLPDFPPDLQI